MNGRKAFLPRNTRLARIRLVWAAADGEQHSTEAQTVVVSVRSGWINSTRGYRVCANHIYLLNLVNIHVF